MTPTSTATAVATTRSSAHPRRAQHGQDRRRRQARAAAENFEAVLSVAVPGADVRRTSSRTALFGGGQGEEMFRSMMFDEYGKQIAPSGGIGIADMVQKEILRMQEAQKP